MQLYFLTLWLIAATMAAPTTEPQTTESNQQVATAVKQKLAKQLPIDNVSYFIVAPVDASSELRRDELALDESADETIDRDVIVDAQQNGGEMMHTAENLVFRPLFSYRKLQEKRNRIYGSKRPVTNNANTVRRSSYVYSRPPYYPTGYYYPY